MLMAREETNKWIEKGNYHLVNRKDYVKAIKCYNRARELEPNYPVSYNNIGAAFYQLGAAQKDEKYFRKAAKYQKKAADLDPTYI